MDRIVAKLTASRPLVMSAMLVCGVLEFVALRRTQVLANREPDALQA